MENGEDLGCGRTPEEIVEYINEGAANEMTASQFVIREEGTLNPANGHFLCTDCYVKAGSPSAPPPGWRAP